MVNEHVTSGGYTFSQHLSLAEAWCQWNGQKGTYRQARRRMEQLSASTLVRMLTERGVRLPIGCEQPALPDRELRA